MIVNCIIWYCIFALATGITSYLSIYRPILKLIKDEYGGSPTTDYPILTAVTLVFFSTLTAPVVLKTALFGASEELQAEIFDDLIGEDETE